MLWSRIPFSEDAAVKDGHCYWVGIVMGWFVKFKISLVSKKEISSSKLPLLKKYWKHLPPPLPPLAPPQLPPLGAGGEGWGGGGGGGGEGGAGGGAPPPQPPPLDPPNMRNKIHITYLTKRWSARMKRSDLTLFKLY